MTSEMGIGEGELRALTRGLDEAHKSTFPVAQKEIADLGARMRQASFGRRGVLVGGFGAIGAVALAACGSSSTGSSAGTGASASPSGSASGSMSPYTGDLKVVALAAALENLAVAGYTTALTMAGQGKLGTVPPAIAEFVTVAKSQHADHAQAWNAVLTQAKLPTVTGTPLTITPATVAAVQASKSVPDVAKVAVGLEQAAAETYLFAVENVSDKGGIGVASTIAPVEAMHAAILNLILGTYPVPDSFLPTDKAAMPSALTA